MSFDELGLSAELLRAIRDEGYDEPTPIQRAAIPPVLAGRDVMAAAQTGTGKTAGFTLPLLHRLASGQKRRTPRVLILTPTRELAAQIEESVRAYGRYLDLQATVVFGGVNIKPQIAALERGVDILVATPGRLLDLCGQRAADLSGVEILVLDEADRMLDMGFIHDIKRVMKLLPTKDKRQNLLFSATFPKEIRTLSKDLLTDPVLVEVAPPNATADRVDQGVYFAEKGEKRALLSALVAAGDWQQVLVFTRTKHGANRLAQQLEMDGHGAMAIHGNKSQSARTRALEAFKSNSLRVLVATDIAARGLDIDQLPHVVNYELPNVPEDYVHRIGRTARAGQSGQAVSLVDHEERKLLRDIERLIGRELPRLDARAVDLDAGAAREPDASIAVRAVEATRAANGGGAGAGNGRGRGKGGGRGHGGGRGGNVARGAGAGGQPSGGVADGGKPAGRGRRRRSPNGGARPAARSAS